MARDIEFALGKMTRSPVISWWVNCGLIALYLSPIAAIASMTSGMENDPMSDCGPGSAPWCGNPLTHFPENLDKLTPAQASTLISLAKIGIQLLRDDIEFDEVKYLFGKQVLFNQRDNEYLFSHPDLQNLTLKITLANPRTGNSNSVTRFDIRSPHFLEGVEKRILEEELGLSRASNYVALSLDRRADIDFSYETGMDSVSCYPVSAFLNYFKDEAYETVDPRADREAKYLGAIIMHRDYMTPAEKAERARRVPQCRSRQPTPRSGLWQPSIPHDAPYAAYFRKQESLSYRVKKGEPMLEVGMDPGSEGRVLWTWVGE